MATIDDAFKQFLEAVDDPAPPSQLLDDAIKWLQDKKILRCLDLESLSDQDMDAAGLPADLPTKAFLRRVWKAATMVAEVKRRKLTQAATDSTSSGDASGSSSALALYVASGGSPPLDVNTLLKDSVYAGLAQHMQPCGRSSRRIKVRQTMRSPQGVRHARIWT